MLTCEHLPPDSRGLIARLELEGVKFNVLFSKAGALRGGDIHPCAQHDFVIRGEVKLELADLGKYKIRAVTAGQHVTIPAGRAHLLTFLQDTVMLEWWDGPFVAEYYEPYRCQVEEHLRAHPTA